MRDITQIMIQGGGPVGLACAAWCLQKNPRLHLTLVDKNSLDDAALTEGDTRGIALSHGSKLLLNTIHAWPEDSRPIHQIHVSQAGRFGRALMTREELNQEALGHITRYHDIHLALRKALRKIANDSPHFQWLNEAPEEIESATCLVHAEGGLFKQQDWVESGRDYHQSALVGLVEVEKPSLNQAWERFTKEGPLALLPSHQGDRFLNLVWCSSPESAQTRLGMSDADFLTDLENTFGKRLGKFNQIQHRRVYELGLNYRKEITQGNEVWIGNSAQTLHPVAGQGLNLGLRDAYLLAEKLARYFAIEKNSSRESLELVLKEYADTRTLDRRVTIRITDFLARVFTSSLLPVQLARGFALSALQWLPPVKSALARQMMFGRR